MSGTGMSRGSRTVKRKKKKALGSDPKYVGGPHDTARQGELVPAGEPLFGHRLVGGIDGRVAPDAAGHLGEIAAVLHRVVGQISTMDGARFGGQRDGIDDEGRY